MIQLKRRLMKKAFTLISKRRKKGLRVTLTFVKLTLIFMLCALEWNVSAQQTTLQANIEKVAKNATIWIGSYEWYVVRHENDYSKTGINYTLLITKVPIAGPKRFSSGSNDYQGSELQTYIKKEYNTYASNYGDIRYIAVVPLLGSYTSTSVTAEPTADMAGHPNTTNDIFFPPSYGDVCKWSGNSCPALGPPVSGSYSHRWWTRTAHDNDRVYVVNSEGSAITDANPTAESDEYVVIGVWVRTTALTYTVSGKIYGLSDISNRTISYTVDNGAPKTVNTDGSGNYTITVPHGAKVIITPPTIADYSVSPDSYTVNNITGSATGKDFTYYIPGFTVNDEDYLAMDGKSYCNTANFTFKANPNTLAGNIVWKLIKGTVIQEFQSAVFSEDNLQEGYYTISLTVSGKTYTTHFAVGSISILWTGTDSNNNWHNPNNWTPAIVPSVCNDVYIPGNLDYYPLLNYVDHNTGKIAKCRNIYFIFGSELGRPDLLTYEKAFMQYNFGLKDINNPQQKGSDKGLVFNSNSTVDRLKFSAEVSATPMSRERWYMLSAPLVDMVTGDLSFGGFPITFLKKFGPINKDNVNYPVGAWTTPYNSMKEPLANQVTDGYAFYMYGLGNGISDLGCEESGVFGQLNELDFMPYRGGGDKRYGLKETNGILELPSFADSTKLYAHRTQLYNRITDKSIFYYINDGSENMSDFNKIVVTRAPDIVERGNNDRNYRFAPEKGGVFATTLQHNMSAIPAGQEFLAGNPYMSSIDMVEFMNDNPYIDPSFRIWNGLDFISCSVLTGNGTVQTESPHSGLNMRYVSPLQGFLLKKASSPVPSQALRASSDYVDFRVANISVVRPNETAFNLRNSAENEEENLLRIKAENSYAASYAVIKYLGGASNDYISGEDVQKLFSPLGYVPSIYFLANEIPVDINFINNNRDVVVPIGIKTEKTGEITLTITGMDNYLKATKIEFIDALENRTVNLTEKPSYTYTFNHKERGVQNGRFSLKISSSITYLPYVKIPNDLEVYGDSKGIYVVSSEAVQKLDVFDFAGRKLYENNSNAKYYPLPDNLSKAPLIVKVVTKNMVKTMKIN